MSLIPEVQVTGPAVYSLPRHREPEAQPRSSGLCFQEPVPFLTNSLGISSGIQGKWYLA